MAQNAGWIWYVIAAVGTYYTARTSMEAEDERNRQLEADRRSAENLAKAEEVARLEELYYANSDIIANAKGIDAYASPSLTAIRQFNFRMHQQNVDDITDNLVADRAAIGAMIKANRRNKRALLIGGMLGTAAQGTQAYAAFRETRVPNTETKESGYRKTSSKGN